ITAWKSRGCLPVAIEVTARIVEIQHMDPFFRKEVTNDTIDSDDMLAMLYSIALTSIKKLIKKLNREASPIDSPRNLVFIGTIQIHILRQLKQSKAALIDVGLVNTHFTWSNFRDEPSCSRHDRF
ncbi:hypothetical protein Taro_051450, partial [Colocasia esculenta]|nr:hypothetical protein [Colocasia esculenta]